ncbi:methyltransferase domain-containing protein [Nesterenkonia lutea]
MREPCADGAAAARSLTSFRGLACAEGHRFDAARQGYVNLLSGRGTRFIADSAPMIMARERVQEAGIFAPLSAHLRGPVLDRLPAPLAVDPDQSPLILDCGAGTGHYLHQLLDAAPTARGIAVDLSTPGLKRAARHRRTLALTWDLWQPLPLRDHSADLLLDVFAPRNVNEYARVLRPGGLAAVVTPRPGHLTELREAGLLGMRSEKLNQLLDQIAPALGSPESIDRITSDVTVNPELAADLVFMGPAGHHRRREELCEEAQRRGVSQVTVDLDVSLWRR